MTNEIQNILALIQERSFSPLSTVEGEGVTYILRGARSYGNITGYPILRITTVNSNHQYFDEGFLLESTRLSGSNGTPADVNISTDAANTLLLLTEAFLA